MNKSPVLYNHLGQELQVRRSVGSLDPNFFKSRRGATGAFDNKVSRQPYAYHPWVYACIERIVNPIASLPKVLYNASRPDDLIYEHEILDLFKYPNPMMCGTDLWEAIILGMLLPTANTPGGQVFLYGESGVKGQKFDWRSGKTPAEIWPYTDNVIKPRKSGDMLTGWKMEIRGQTLMEFEFHELIRIRKYNPYSIEQGLSPYSPAQIPILQDTKADEFNTMYLDNHGAIGGLLTTDSDTVTPDQMREFKEAFEEEYMGSGNAGKVAALAYGLKYEAFVKSNRDMEFSEQRNDNRLRIQAVFGMNEQEIGIFDSGMNRATAEQADRSVWQKTRIPLDDKIWESINSSWLRYVGDGKMRGKSDRSKVEALREDYSAKIADAEKLHNMMVPPEEALRIAGVPVDLSKAPWLSKKLVPMSMVPIEMVLSGETIYKPGSEPTDPPKEDKPKEDSSKSIVVAIKTLERDRMWEEYVALSLDPGEKSMRKMWEKYFYSLRNEMQDNVDEWLKMQAKMVIKMSALDPNVFLFNLLDANDALVSIYGPQAAEQMRRESARLASKYDINWAVSDDKIGRFVQRRKSRLYEINNLTFSNARAVVSETISKGLQESLTPQEMARAIKQSVGDLAQLSIGRSKVIARTETGSITSDSRYNAFKDAAIIQHEWLTSKDERVRATHQAVDGEQRQVGIQFSNGLMHPLDQNGLPENVINCRCTTIPILD